MKQSPFEMAYKEPLKHPSLSPSLQSVCATFFSPFPAQLQSDKSRLWKHLVMHCKNSLPFIGVCTVSQRGSGLTRAHTCTSVCGGAKVCRMTICHALETTPGQKPARLRLTISACDVCVCHKNRQLNQYSKAGPKRGHFRARLREHKRLQNSKTNTFVFPSLLLVDDFLL